MRPGATGCAGGRAGAGAAWLVACGVVALAGAGVARAGEVTAGGAGGVGAAAGAGAGDARWVDMQVALPDAKFEIRYATKDNFVGEAVYESARCFLRKAAAEKVMRAAAELRGKGFGIVFYDCYRPLAVQEKLWAKKPDPRYVMNPKQGSMHNRGGAVDAGLFDLKTGTIVEMPSAYDEFTERAHHSYAKGSKAATAHRAVLKGAMEKAGMRAIATEWWHYSDPGFAKAVPENTSFAAIAATLAGAAGAGGGAAGGAGKKAGGVFGASKGCGEKKAGDAGGVGAPAVKQPMTAKPGDKPVAGDKPPTGDCELKL